MYKIIRERLRYILTVLFIWSITLPYIYWKRDSLHNWLALKLTKSYYSVSRMKSFIEDGDSEILKSIQLPYIKDRCQKEKSKKEDCMIEEHLNIMQNACVYSAKIAKEAPPFEEPGWVEKKSIWTSDPDKSRNGLGIGREELPKDIKPQSYWKKNKEAVLTALDYYKRALNVSGPQFVPVMKLHKAAQATCQERESFMAFITYIFNTEKFVLEGLAAEKKVPSFLSEKQKSALVWTHIKQNKLFAEDINPNDYVYALQELLIPEKGYRHKSPEEANEFFERLIFFARDDEWNENLIRFKWGNHLYQMGKLDSKYYKKSILQLQASTVFTDSYLKPLSISRIRKIQAHRFEANLITAKSYMKLKDYHSALQHLEVASRILKIADGRAVSIVELDLIKDFKSAMKETYTALGKSQLADSMDDSD